jgi:hypothetical protein
MAGNVWFTKIPAAEVKVALRFCLVREKLTVVADTEKSWHTPCGTAHGLVEGVTARVSATATRVNGASVKVTLPKDPLAAPANV